MASPQLEERAAAVAQIVAALQSDSDVEASFRRLIALYSRPLRGFFAKRGVSDEECRDLTQEVFVGIYTGIAGFRGDAGFDTWVFKIATNVYRKHLRRHATGKRSGEEVPLPGQDQGEEAAATPEGLRSPPAAAAGLLAEERVRVLRDAVERLPDQMRKCLLLRIERDLKYREIGVVLRLSPETVKVHLFQARKRLQGALGGYFLGELAPLAEEGRDR
jgi:RNA polymerase sigma-70 factor (ECF subfamily)